MNASEIKKTIPPEPVLSKSWSLRELKLPREEMIQAIDGSQSVPPKAKELLKDAVAALEPKISLVRLDAHSFASGSHITIHLTVAKL